MPGTVDNLPTPISTSIHPSFLLAWPLLGECPSSYVTFPFSFPSSELQQPRPLIHNQASLVWQGKARELDVPFLSCGRPNTLRHRVTDFFFFFFSTLVFSYTPPRRRLLFELPAGPLKLVILEWDRLFCFASLCPRARRSTGCPWPSQFPIKHQPTNFVSPDCVFVSLGFIPVTRPPSVPVPLKRCFPPPTPSRLTE